MFGKASLFRSLLVTVSLGTFLLLFYHSSLFSVSVSLDDRASIGETFNKESVCGGDQKKEEGETVASLREYEEVQRVLFQQRKEVIIIIIMNI